jgi:hypothetical protein
VRFLVRWVRLAWQGAEAVCMTRFRVGDQGFRGAQPTVVHALFGSCRAIPFKRLRVRGGRRGVGVR